MQLVLDIETIPCQRPDARERAKDGIRPPGNIKLPATIERWWKDEAPGAIEDAFRRQALDAAQGEIASIALIAVDIDDDPGAVRCRRKDESESDLLQWFFDQVRQRLEIVQTGLPDGMHCDPFFVGHNTAFDLGFIWRRCVVHELRPPFYLPSPSARPDRNFGCTMTWWSGHNGRISLDALCRALSIPSPKEEGIDGAMVYGLWGAGEYDRIARYNLQDVLATRQVWHRLQGGMRHD